MGVDATAAVWVLADRGLLVAMGQALSPSTALLGMLESVVEPYLGMPESVVEPYGRLLPALYPRR